MSLIQFNVAARRRRGFSAFVGLLAAVATPRAGAADARPTVASGPAARAPIVFRGMCDASGAVVLGGWFIAVADDEDNVLRVYDGRRGGDPIDAVDVSAALQLAQKKRTPELDIEAATRVGEYAFWLTSHGRSSKGKVQESRLRFFATSAPAMGKGLTPVGKPYRGLLDDLLAAPQLESFGLTEAALLPPKEAGGLNIEGMTARPDGRSVLIGFRNPLPRGRALVVPLLNPLALVRGKHAKFGAAKLLDLNGLGVRALSWWRGRYLIIGGAISPGGTSHLYTWDGEEDKPTAVAFDWGDLNPEAFAAFADSAEILVLSDDGGVLIDGTPCKRQDSPASKRFRGVWITVPTVPPR